MSDEVKNSPESTEETEEKSEAEESGEITEAPESKDKEKKEEKVPFEIIEAKDEENSIRAWKVTVPWEEFDKRREESLKDISKNVVIPGFRKGKAPAQLVKIRFRKEIEGDILEEIVPSVTSQLLEKEERTSVSDPMVTEYNVEEGKPVEIEIKTEVIPEISLDKDVYTGKSISVDKLRVDDEIIDQHIEDLRQKNAIYTPKEDGVVKEGDSILVNVTVTDETEEELPFLKKEEEFIQHPEEVFPEEVMEKILGSSKETTVVADVPNERKSEAGIIKSNKDIWSVEILDIKECELPELDDEFAKDLGDFESLEDLRSKIRKGMESHAENHAREKAITELLDKIVDKIDVDVPPTLLNLHMRALIADDAEKLRRMGIPPDLLMQEKDKYLESKKEAADAAAKTSLLYRHISEKEDIKVMDEDVQKAIEDMAEHEGRKPLAIRARLEAQKQLGSLKDSLQTRKVEDYLLEKNEVDYNEVSQEDLGKSRIIKPGEETE